MLSWHVVRTKPRQEGLVWRGLLEQDFVPYIPKKTEREMVGRRARAVTVPRFHGLVFVQFDSRLEMHGPINSTRGTYSTKGNPALMCDAKGNPKAMRDREVDILRLLECDELITAMKPASKDNGLSEIEPGSWVKIDARVKLWGGMEGQVISSERGVSKVAIAWLIKEVENVDLTLIEAPDYEPAPAPKRKR